VNDEIRFFNQIREIPPISTNCRIDKHASLVGVEMRKCSRLTSHRIASWRFNLNHVSADVCEHLAAIRTGRFVRELQYTKVT